MTESKTFSEREKLIELLQNVPTDFEGNRNVGTIADYLLANGVTTLPCKIGDTVWLIDGKNVKGVCGRKLCKPALEIINHQKEMLKGWEESFCELSKIATPSVNYLIHAKFNIIKEFVRQQKEIMRSFLDDNNDFVMKWSEYEANTDNLVRKITGGYDE